MAVLDAAAVLALVHDEPGSELVASELHSATLSAANLAEVLTADPAWTDLELPVQVRLIR